MRQGLSRACACVCACTIPLLFWHEHCIADITDVDKIYTPHVEAGEREIEYRLVFDDDANAEEQAFHKLGYGHALNDDFLFEFYAIGMDTKGDGLDLTGFEAELIWQLTEHEGPGTNWGVLFELGRNTEENEWEQRTALLAMHETHHWAAVANLSLEYAWGSGIENEWEAGFAGQLRHHYSEHFKPALEVYFAKDQKGAGPILLGEYDVSESTAVEWQFGVIFGMDQETPDRLWKLIFMLEF